MASEADNLQRDAQRAATQDDAYAAQLDGRLKDLHTAIPGVVASYDAVKRTCSVQPAIQRIFGGVATNLPLLVDCPVVFPEGGGFILTFPIVAGDEVLVIFSERAIDNWYAAGGTKPPSEYRMHDLSDGYALAGISNQTRNVEGVSTTAAELRTRDGAVRFRVSPTSITAESDLFKATGNARVEGNLSVGTGATGTFPTSSGKVVTVVDGIVTNIA